MSRSPFPGMDPYLEDRWRSVHARLNAYIVDQLNERLPDDLVARIEESAEIASEMDVRSASPDVHVHRHGGSDASGTDRDAATTSGAAVAVPIRARIPIDTPPQRWVEIIDYRDRDPLITAIELISPKNKSHPAAYRRKQSAYLEGGVNLIEIDFIRRGPVVSAFPLELLEGRENSYTICVRREADPGLVELYPVGMWERVPDVAVPLRRSDEDVVLSLQPLIEQIYDRGRFAGSIDYTEELRPPLPRQIRERLNAVLGSA